MPDAERSDRELMAALIDGDGLALARIVERWEKPLFSFAFRYTQNHEATRDIVQETFARVYLKREKYNFKYPLTSWIFTIAANLCKNNARWARRHPETSLDAPLGDDSTSERTVVQTIASDAQLPSESLSEKEELDLLRNAVMALPHDLRTAVLLHHYEDLSYKEIAEVVGCSARGVETRLYRARKALRIQILKLKQQDVASKKKADFAWASEPCRGLLG